MTNSNKILNGRKIAEQLLNEMVQEVYDFKSEGVVPGIAFIVVGNDPASALYVDRKIKIAKKVGMQSFILKFDASVQTEQILQEISTLNSREDVHGILVQLPLPQHLDTNIITNAVLPVKDVDGFTLENIGKLITRQPGLVPCTPQACLFLIKQVCSNLSGMHAVVIGRSKIVGQPMMNLLLHENCTVTILHSHSIQPEIIASTADILISATGHAHLVTEKWVKQDAIVIDVGITKINDGTQSQILGDANFDRVIDKVKAITPVPGGVGPMTVAFLMQNTLEALRMQTPEQCKN